MFWLHFFGHIVASANASWHALYMTSSKEMCFILIKFDIFMCHLHSEEKMGNVGK